MIADALAARLANLIDRYGSTVSLKQAGTGVTVANVPVLVRLAVAGDHTPFASSTAFDTWTKPAYVVTFAGSPPMFGGSVAITTTDYITLTPPGGTSADYTIRAITETALLGNASVVKTVILVSQ